MVVIEPLQKQAFTRMLIPGNRLRTGDPLLSYPGSSTGRPHIAETTHNKIAKNKGDDTFNERDENDFAKYQPLIEEYINKRLRNEQKAKLTVFKRN